MSDQHEAIADPPPEEVDPDDESLLEGMRGSGVGVEDPNIVGDPTPTVDEHVAEDEPPKV